MPAKKVTRKKSNNPVVDTALSDIYDKLDKLQPINPRDRYTTSNQPEFGTMTTVEVTGNESDSGTISSAVYTKNGWMVDINSNYKRIGTTGFIASEGMKGRSKTPVQGEALSYDKNHNVVIGNTAGEKVLLKNEGSILKVRNMIDTADAILKAKRLQVDVSTAGTTNAIRGELQFNATGNSFYLHGIGLALDANTTGSSGDQSVFATLSKKADSVIKLFEGSTHKWTLGYDMHGGTTFTCGGTSDTVSGDRTITMDDTTPGANTIAVGMLISGSGIPSGSVVTEITDGTHIEISEEATATANNITATFKPLDERFKIHCSNNLADTSDFMLDDNGNLIIAGGLTAAGITSITSTTQDQFKVKYNDSNYGLINVANDGHVEIESVGTDADMTLNADGDIELNAHDGNIAFKANLSTFATFAAGDFITFYDTNNNIRLNVSSAGVATFTTSGGTAADADFIVDAGGDIALDSGTGNFIAKKAGTEFSVANSAYAGMIVGYTRIQNNSTTSGDATITVNSSQMTVIQTAQGTNVSVVFKAPPSGNVEIEASFWMQSISDGAKFSLSDMASYNEVDAAYTYDADWTVYYDETDHDMHTIRFAVTGLTAGNSYTYFLAGLASGAGVSILHGDNRASGSHYPPIIMKAIALPAIITTGE